MAKTGGGREECAHDSHLTRAVDARHAARSYETGLEPCVNALSTLATRPRFVRKTRFRSRARASERPRAIAHTRKAKPGCCRSEAGAAARLAAVEASESCEATEPLSNEVSQAGF